MKLSYLLLPVIFIVALTSCRTIDKTENTALKDVEVLSIKAVQDPTDKPKAAENKNLNQLCNPEFYVYHPVIPVAPITGTERAEPIVLMTRKEFNERIQLSPLWESLYNKRVSNGSYGSRYSFTTLGKLIGSNGKIYVKSRLDGHYWKESQRITEVSYGSAIVSIRSQYGHQLLDQERLEMIETLKLVIDDIDHEKAAEMIDQLYKQYRQKVANKEYLSDGQTIHTYLEYDGKYIALWGSQRLDHEIKQCNYEVLSGLTIS